MLRGWIDFQMGDKGLLGFGYCLYGFFFISDTGTPARVAEGECYCRLMRWNGDKIVNGSTRCIISG